MYSVVFIECILVTGYRISMAGRHQPNPSAAVAGQDLYSTDARHCTAINSTQQTNGHVDFAFRKRLEKIDWRKIGMCETIV